ncbi:MAG: UDP-N-acetylglucosamine 1-carboxyvinyltransferase [Candidatus Andersenbacteria bacterium]
MSHFVIRGGQRLGGTIPVHGSKNAALPLLAASLLTHEPITYHNIPDILDVKNLITILMSLGVAVQQTSTQLTLQTGNITPEQLATDSVGLLRGSILLMGALLGRTRHITLPHPGGDLIGVRPITAHLDAFSQLGAHITESNGQITIAGGSLRAGKVVLSEFSVTATENIMLAAATLPGVTTIEIAAAEPHVVALAQLLTKMGAIVKGAGTHTITVAGKEKLTGTTFTNIPDMLEAGAFVLMAAATQSAITLENVPLGDLTLFWKKTKEMGIDYSINEAGQTVTVQPAPLTAFRLQSLPHPGIATDLQAPFSVVATQAKGTSLIHDPLYEGRFRHITELQKMGAQVTVCDPHRVIIQGLTPLHGQRIPSLDIRSGITLLIAGLVAEGETIIDQAEIIDRGYARIPERLTALGAQITRQP